MANNRSIALFDFDGTVTTKDTLLEFTRHAKGSTALYSGMLRIFPYLIANNLSLINSQLVKEKFLTHFFSGMTKDHFDELSTDFSINVIPSLVRPKAMEKILWHKQNDHTIVIVTASLKNWISPWCNQLNVECICSEMLVSNNMITGKLSTKNCKGIEKVTRIQEIFNPKEFSEIYAYGDTKSDFPMLKLATHPFYKPFRN